MKTPRAILFDRHRSAEPKLDQLRESLVGQLSEGSAQDAEHDAGNRAQHSGRPLFFEFIASIRWHLAGMSAVWGVSLLLNLNGATESAPLTAKENVPSPRQIVTALRENRRQLLELTETPAPETIPSPGALGPRRREEFGFPSALA